MHRNLASDIGQEPVTLTMRVCKVSAGIGSFPRSFGLGNSACAAAATFSGPRVANASRSKTGSWYNENVLVALQRNALAKNLSKGRGKQDRTRAIDPFRPVSVNAPRIGGLSGCLIGRSEDVCLSCSYMIRLWMCKFN